MRSHTLLAVGIMGAGFLLPTSQTRAASVYTAGHGDLGIEYTPGDTEFEAHWHIGAGATVDGTAVSGLDGEEFAPGDLVARLSTTATVSNIKVANGLGVSTGTTAYRTGSNAYPPNLGFAIEEAGDPGDWLDETITLTLTGFSGPGALAISQTIPAVGTFVWFSSVGDGFTQNDNKWDLAVGAHQHLEIWFTQPGNYDLELTWTGKYIGGVGPDVDVVGSGTFGFQVVPEPGAVGMLASGLLGMMFLRRRVA